PPPALDLVIPPARAMQADGAYRIPAGEQIVLALRGGEWMEPIIEIIDEETGQASEIELEIGAGEVLRIGPFKPGAHRVHVRDWQLVSIRLAAVDADPVNVLPAEIRTVSKDGVTELRASLLHEDAGKRWTAVFFGKEIWRGVSLPDRWPVSVAWSSKK